MKHLKKIVCILCTFVVLFNIIVINVYAITDTDKNEVDITARTKDGVKQYLGLQVVELEQPAVRLQVVRRNMVQMEMGQLRMIASIRL